MRRLVLLAVPLIMLLVTVGVIAGLAHPRPQKHSIIIIKPQNQSRQQQQQQQKTQFIRINVPGGVLTFYASQLDEFEIVNGYIVIGFEGELRLGPGTYTLYNVSSCRIGGQIEILRIFDNAITIHVTKDMYIRDCTRVVLRLVS